MGTITLSLPVTATTVTSGLHIANYTAIQALANGGIDNNNFASGLIFDNTKIMQGGATAGQALVWNNGATQWQPAYTPGHEYAYTAFTAPVSVTATTEGTANTVVTASAVTFDGATIVMVEFFAPDTLTPAANAELNYVLYDGAASVGKLGRSYSVAGATDLPIRLTYRLTPSAAAKTYSIRAYVSSGTGTVSAGAGGIGNFVPGFIRITKV